MSDDEFRDYALEACTEFGRRDFSAEQRGASSRSGSATSTSRRGPSRCGRRVDARPRRSSATRVTAAALPERAADGGAEADRARRGGRDRRRARGSSWRSRSAPTSPAPASSTTRSTRSSPSSRSSGSTTSSARRRPRTSSRSASPTASSSRSGTAPTSPTSRSTSRRRSRSAAAGRFYEETGAYRDMVVTHLMQILAFLAMEPPTQLEPLAITEEKNKVFRSIRPIDPAKVVRGQYEGYRSEPGVDPQSETETMIAPALRGRQLALVRGAVLPADRQADGRGRADHLDRLPRAAAEHVPRRFRRRPVRARPPDLRPRRLRPRSRCRSTASGRGRR